MVKIEKMSEKHIAQVAEIEESIFSVPWSQKAFKDSLELDNTAFYVAIEEEGVIGYCGVYKVMNSADITNVAVKKDKRKKGVAKQLLKEAIKDAKSEQIKEIKHSLNLEALIESFEPMRLNVLHNQRKHHVQIILKIEFQATILWQA